MITRRHLMKDAVVSIVVKPLPARAQHATSSASESPRRRVRRAAIDGLRHGLRELGLQEEKQFVLHVRDVGGDLKSVGAASAGSRSRAGGPHLHAGHIHHARRETRFRVDHLPSYREKMT